MSKGSVPRPYSVPKETFDQSFDWAFGITCKKCDYMVLYAGQGHCYMFKDKPTECKQFKEYSDVSDTGRTEDTDRV